MQHTFLFLEGTWVIDGIYSIGAKRSVSLEGMINVLYLKEEIVMQTYVKMFTDFLCDFHIYTSIKPFDHLLCTRWNCVNTVMGSFQGDCLIEGERIIWNYEQDHLGYRRIDYYQKLDDTTYQIVGQCLKGDEMISYWRAEMIAKFLKKHLP